MKKKLTKEVKNMQNENSKHRALSFEKEIKEAHTHIQNGKTFHVHELEDNIVKISILLNVI